MDLPISLGKPSNIHTYKQTNYPLKQEAKEVVIKQLRESQDSSHLRSFCRFKSTYDIATDCGLTELPIQVKHP